MQQVIIDKLSEITPEEERLLRNEPLDLFDYNRKGKPVIEPGSVLKDGALFGIRKHTRFVDFPRHSHQYVEMIYQIQGETKHLINGVAEMNLTPGKLLLLGRGVEHEIEASDENCIAVNFILIPAFFDNAAIRLGGHDALAVFLRGNLYNTKVSSGFLVFQASDSVQVENLLENLILGHMSGIDMEIQQMTLELLVRHLSQQASKLLLETKENKNQTLVLNILSKLENQVRVNLSELAKEADMDVSALSRAIKHYTGCTFSELAQTARFNQAVVMLRDTDVSIVDITAALGYENTAFFYRSFQQQFGCTPGEYRARTRKQGQT